MKLIRNNRRNLIRFLGLFGYDNRASYFLYDGIKSYRRRYMKCNRENRKLLSVVKKFLSLCGQRLSMAHTDKKIDRILSCWNIPKSVTFELKGKRANITISEKRMVSTRKYVKIRAEFDIKKGNYTEDNDANFVELRKLCPLLSRDMYDEHGIDFFKGFFRRMLYRIGINGKGSPKRPKERMYYTACSIDRKKEFVDYTKSEKIEVIASWCYKKSGKTIDEKFASIMCDSMNIDVSLFNKWISYDEMVEYSLALRGLSSTNSPISDEEKCVSKEIKNDNKEKEIVEEKESRRSPELEPDICDIDTTAMDIDDYMYYMSRVGDDFSEDDDDYW